MTKPDPRAMVPAAKAGPVRTSSGTRPAIRLTPVPRAPSANDLDDTKQIHAAELREMALRCASDVGPAGRAGPVAPRPQARPEPPPPRPLSPTPLLADLVEDADVLDDAELVDDADLAEVAPLPLPPAPPPPAPMVESTVEATFFAREVVEHATEPSVVASPTVPPAAPLRVDRRSEVSDIFRREILGEGYFVRRFVALALLFATIAALGGDVLR